MEFNSEKAMFSTWFFNNYYYIRVFLLVKILSIDSRNSIYLMILKWRWQTKNIHGKAITRYQINNLRPYSYFCGVCFWTLTVLNIQNIICKNAIDIFQTQTSRSFITIFVLYRFTVQCKYSKALSAVSYNRGVGNFWFFKHLKVTKNRLLDLVQPCLDRLFRRLRFRWLNWE